MLLPEHERFHKLAPSEVGLKEPTFIQVARTTNQTGEQFQFAVPVYPDDTREALKDRLGFFLSLAQERMEEENRAVEALNAKQREIRHAKILVEKNNQNFVNKVKDLKKRVRRGKMTADEANDAMKALREELRKANVEMVSSLTKANEEVPAEPVIGEEDVSPTVEPSPDH